MFVGVQEIIKVLGGSGYPVQHFRFGDAGGYLIPKTDMARLWQAWVHSLPRALVDQSMKPAHVPETWDCDNRALDLAAWLGRSNALTRRGSPGGLWAGPVWYMDDKIGFHAAVLGINTRRQPYLFEPVTGRSRQMTDAEIFSIKHGCFV